MKQNRLFVPVLMIAAGLLFLFLAVFTAAAGSADFAALFGLSGLFRNSPALRDTVTALPLPPYILVAVLTFLFMLLFLSGIVSLVSALRNRAFVRALDTELEDLMMQQLGIRDTSEPAVLRLKARLTDLRETFVRRDEELAALEKLDGELRLLSEEEQGYESAIGEQQTIQHELEKKLDHLAGLRNRAEQLRHTISENDAVTEELDALNLALETLSELSGSLSQSFGYHLNAEAGRLISGITDGAYDSIWISDSLDLYLNTRDRTIPVSDVSGGTMDQVYLALRLAAATLLQEDSPERLPLILDDSFAMYDDLRLAHAVSFVREYYPGQLLLFTCQTREERLLAGNGSTYHLVRI